RDRCAGNDDGRADIATHGVKRDSNLLRHERPGNHSSRSQDSGEPPGQPAPGPGGDNSVSRPGANLFTAPLCPKPRHDTNSPRSKNYNYFKALLSILKATSDRPIAKC